MYVCVCLCYVCVLVLDPPGGWILDVCVDVLEPSWSGECEVVPDRSTFAIQALGSVFCGMDLGPLGRSWRSSGEVLAWCLAWCLGWFWDVSVVLTWCLGCCWGVSVVFSVVLGWC